MSLRLRDVSLTACLAALLLLASPAVRAYSQDKPPDQLRTLSRAELDVVKVLTAQENAWNRGDLDAFATGYKDSPDTLFIGRQVSRGYAQMLADYKGNYPNREAMGTLGFSDLEPRILDDKFAVVVGKYHLDRGKKAGGAAEGLFSLILEKTDKGWKIIVDHTT
jgi:ketosteroid isomerase-like protein